MPAKTDTEVIIGGQVLTLSGHESEEYLQRVASYINNKLSEYNKLDSFKRQSSDRRNVLIQLNIADDYFKAKRQGSALELDVEQKDKEMYDLKHELISTQIKCENLEQELEKLKEENQKLQMQIVKLETEKKNQAKLIGLLIAILGEGVALLIKFIMG